MYTYIYTYIDVDIQIYRYAHVHACMHIIWVYGNVYICMYGNMGFRTKGRAT